MYHPEISLQIYLFCRGEKKELEEECEKNLKVIEKGTWRQTLEEA